jgi:hypothetical protein
MTMRSQDLRLARHSVASDLDLAISLLAKVRDDGSLEPGAREKAAEILDAAEAIHATDGLTGEERRVRLAPIVAHLEQLDDAVNGPLPSEV